MSTMYIAGNHCTEHECFLGDVITMIKAAYLFVENEPHQNVLLSLFEHEPLNFLWIEFIESHRVKVVWDDWPRKDKCAHYHHLQKRLNTRRVHGVSFDTYKELYPRIAGPDRQILLCGENRGVHGKNIFEYYYFGQHQYVDKPKQSNRFDPGIIRCRRNQQVPERSVFIAPHEQCQRNRVFTLQFWEEVTNLLLEEGVRVILNTQSFMKDRCHTLLETTYKPLAALIDEVASQQLVVCGNTGIGWVAAATGVPFIAMERDMFMEEYSYEKCGCQSLVETVREPDPLFTAKTVLRYLTQKLHQKHSHCHAGKSDTRFE